MTENDIYVATEAMLVRFTDVDVNNVLRAYPSQRVSLPSNNDYIIMTLLSAQRIDTPSASWTTNDYTVSQDKRAIMQLDFFGTNADIRSNVILDLSRSSVLCDFLENYGILPLYADDVSNNTGVSGEKQYVERRTLQLHINYQTDVTVEADTFSAINLNIFETEL